MGIAGAFALTLIVELALAFFLFGGKGRLYPVFLCNLLTNPALNVIIILVTGLFGAGAYWPCLVLLEIAAVLIEARVLWLLCGLSAKKALAISLALNAASFCVGLLLRLVV